MFVSIHLYVVTSGEANTAYLACDDEPVTREEICAASLASKLFPSYSMPKVSIYRIALLYIVECVSLDDM